MPMYCFQGISSNWRSESIRDCSCSGGVFA
jgi:hypothetical protein